jgi:hypothetical protein
MSKICRTFAADLERNIMKVMYKQPKTDVTVVNTAYMLMDTMSPAGSGGGGATEAPARRSVGPAVPGETL